MFGFWPSKFEWKFCVCDSDFLIYQKNIIFSLHMKPSAAHPSPAQSCFVQLSSTQFGLAQSSQAQAILAHPIRVHSSLA